MTLAIVGDCLAVGLAQQLPHDIVDAKVGVPSADIIHRVHPADVLIVSAGSNDPENTSLLGNLNAIRRKATGRVIWIVPIHKRAAALVTEVGMRNGDSLIHFVPGGDNIHPKSYIALARRVRPAL